MINTKTICETEKIPVFDDMSYQLVTAFVSSESDEDNEKAVVVVFHLYDQAGEIVNVKIDGLISSNKYGYFLYSNFANKNNEVVSHIHLRFPKPIAYVQLTVIAWQASGDVTCKAMPRLIAKKQKDLYGKACLYESDYIDIQAGAAYRVAFADQASPGSGEPVQKAFVMLFRFFDSQLQLCDMDGLELPISPQLGRYMYVNLSASGQITAIKNFHAPENAHYIKLAILSWHFNEKGFEVQQPELMLLLDEGTINVCGGEVYTVSYMYPTDFPDDTVFSASAYNEQGDLLDIFSLVSTSASFSDAAPLEEPGICGEGRKELHLAIPQDAVRVEYALSWRGTCAVPRISNIHISQKASLLSPGKTSVAIKILPYLTYQLDLQFYSSEPAPPFEIAFYFPSPTSRYPIGPNNFRHGGEVQLVHDVFACTASASAPWHSSAKSSSLRLFITPPGGASELVITAPDNTTSFIHYKIVATDLLEGRLDGVHDINATPLENITFSSADGLNKLLTHILKRNIYAEDKKGLLAFLDYCHKKGWLTLAAAAARGLLSLPAPDMAIARKARAILGEVRELGVGWIPDLGEPTAPEKNASSSLRIAHFFKTAIPHEYTGGSIRCANIVKFQKKAGLDPLVVLPLGYPDQSDTGGIFHMYEHFGVPHYQITPISFKDALAVPADKRIWADSILAYELLRDKNISVIQSSSGYRGYELALKGLAVARKLGVPFVYEVRSFHEHTWNVTDAWVLNAERTQMRIAQENACMQKADAVVTICETMRQELIKRGIPEEKITIVPNSVDVQMFYPRTPDTELKKALGLDDKQIIGYISNLSKREGHEVLLRAIALLRETHKDIACLVVGEGPQLADLQDLATELGISDTTIFTGGIPHEDIAEYYALIDIFVVPRIPDYASDYVTPMKPIEAMAMKRPIIASDRPALRELLADDRGLLFTAGDHKHLADQIRIVSDDERLRNDLAEKGHNWILADRTWDKTIARYSALYASLLH